MLNDLHSDVRVKVSKKNFITWNNTRFMWWNHKV